MVVLTEAVVVEPEVIEQAQRLYQQTLITQLQLVLEEVTAALHLLLPLAVAVIYLLLLAAQVLVHLLHRESSLLEVEVEVMEIKAGGM